LMRAWGEAVNSQRKKSVHWEISSRNKERRFFLIVMTQKETGGTTSRTHRKGDRTQRIVVSCLREKKRGLRYHPTGSSSQNQVPQGGREESTTTLSMRKRGRRGGIGGGTGPSYALLVFKWSWANGKKGGSLDPHSTDGGGKRKEKEKGEKRD